MPLNKLEFDRAQSHTGWSA